MISEQAKQILGEIGLVVDEVHIDGELHRVSTVDKPGARNGWYRIDPVRKILYGGNWATDQSVRQPLGSGHVSNVNHLTARSVPNRNEQIAQQYRDTAKRCQDQIMKSTPAYNHGYLTLKQLLPFQGLYVSDNKLLIPLRDIHGKVWNIQSIWPNTKKLFSKGGRTKGLFHIVNHQTLPYEGKVYIAEGYATAASLYIDTQVPSVAAMTANNLKNVAMVLREHRPQLDIIICADDDRFTRGNPGITKAKEAAAAVGAKVVSPEFCQKPTCQCTDYNDRHCCVKEM